MRPRLLFVYNADSDLFSTVTDFAHKILSPTTYACRLCALTYGSFSMKSAWKEFLEQLGTDNEFLHKDELERLYHLSGVSLPAVLIRNGATIETLLSAEEINRCRTLPELMASLSRKVNRLREDGQSQGRLQ